MCATVSDYTSGKLLLKSPWFNLAQFILFTGHRRDTIFNFKTDYELLEYEVEVDHSDFHSLAAVWFSRAIHSQWIGMKLSIEISIRRGSKKVDWLASL